MAKPKRRPSVAPGENVPVELIATPDEGTLTLRWIGPIRGILTHWGKSASLACPGRADCPSTIHRGKTFWKGYAAVEYYRGGQYRDWAPAVFEVTERLYDVLDGAILRGTIWVVKRQVGLGGQKEVTGEQTGECNEECLRQPWSVEPVVCRIYRSTHILFDVEPLMPKRIVLPPSLGTDPFAMPDAKAVQAGENPSSYAVVRQQILDGQLDPRYEKSLPRLVQRVKADLDKEGLLPRERPRP